MTQAREDIDAELDRREQATLWLQALHAPDTDEKTIESWLEWCARDPRNQQAFDDMAAIWVMSAEPRAETNPPTEITKGTEPHLQTPPRARRPRRRYGFALAASIALFALGAGTTWLLRAPAPEPQTRLFASAAGVNQVETLSDGSTLELGGRTRAAASFSRDARQVDLLSGEVFVTVASERSRSFTVTAGPLRIVALGTRFNVLRTPERTVVTVVEGNIGATDGAPAGALPTGAEHRVRLSAGQQLTYTEATHSFAVRWADPETAIAWRTGTLRFSDEPLAAVIASINRYAPFEIVIDDVRIAALTFTGTARTDRIDSWLAALELVFPVTVVDLGDGRRLISPRLGTTIERPTVR